MSQVVGRGKTVRLNIKFYLYENGPAFDPIGDGVRPRLSLYFNDTLQFGPFDYSNGTGDVKRDGVGSFYYDFAVPNNVDLGSWTAHWDGGPTAIIDEEFIVVQINETPNPAENLLKKPSISASMSESPLYQIMGTGITDPIFLVGHADGIELNDPYQVTSIKEAVNLLGADSRSPLLRGLLELYYSGARDIYLVAAAPMEEYVDSLVDRTVPIEEWGLQTYYEKYYERLTLTYSFLTEWDTADILIPLEAPFNDTGGVDFLGQLVSHCQESYVLSGKVRLGLLGTRGAISDSMVESLLNDGRISQFGDEGKFVTVIVGDGVVNNKEIPVSYSASVVTSIAGVLSQLRLDRGITYIPIPNIVSLVGKDLSQEQVQNLALAKLNPIIRNLKSKRGSNYNIVVATDNTLASDGSDYWSLLQVRLITKVIERIRLIGLNYIGSVSYFDFKAKVESYMVSLTRSNQIRDFTLLIQRDPDDRLRATVDVSIRPYFGIREIFGMVSVGPSISLGAVR